MPPDGRRRMMARRLVWTVVALLMVIAGLLVVLGTRPGVGASTDSVSYVSGARNLADGRGLVDYTLTPITAFPPGFSTTLAIGDRLGIDAADGARALNVLAFAALVFLTFVLARRHVRNVWLSVGASAAVAFAPAVLGVYTFAWSEPVFNVLVLAMLLVVEPLFAQRGRSPVLLLLAAVVAGVAFSYRYAGITVLALPAAVIVASAWRDGARALLGRLSTYAGLALLLPALIIARNLSEGAEALGGDRSPSDQTFPEVMGDVMRTLGEWALESRLGALSYGVLAAVGCVVAVGLGSALRGWTRGPRRARAPLFPLVTYVLGYLVYLTASELTTSLDPVSTRLLSPIFAPTVVLVAVALQEILTADWRGAHRLRRWAEPGFTALLVFWLVVSLRASLATVRDDGEVGQGYASRSWQASKLARLVQDLPPRAPVMSNAYAGLYYVSGHLPVYSNPTKVRSPDGYVAWFARRPAGRGVPTEVHGLGLPLCTVANTRDGTLYRVIGDRDQPSMETLPPCSARMPLPLAR